MNDSALRYDIGKPQLHHIAPEIWDATLMLEGTDLELYSWSAAMDDAFFFRSLIALRAALRPNELKELTPVLEFGATKYAALNYAKGMLYSRVLNSFRRHVLAVVQGEVNDKESGLPHRAHALCNMMFLALYTIKGMDEFDDRPKEYK